MKLFFKLRNTNAGRISKNDIVQTLELQLSGTVLGIERPDVA